MPTGETHLGTGTRTDTVRATPRGTFPSMPRPHLRRSSPHSVGLTRFPLRAPGPEASAGR